MRKDVPVKEEVWIRVVVAYVQSSNSTTVMGAINWADKISEAYAQRFESYRGKQSG